MKQFLAAVLVAVLVIPSPVLAHGGRTDASGGHTDRSTGEYHYHHGYSAHQHPNGVCPYNFDDQTDHSSGSSSGSSSSAEASWDHVDSHFFEEFRYNEATDEWLHDDGTYYESSAELFDCYGFYYNSLLDVWYNEDGYIDEDFRVLDHSAGGYFYCDSCETLMDDWYEYDPDFHSGSCSYIAEIICCEDEPDYDYYDDSYTYDSPSYVSTDQEREDEAEDERSIFIHIAMAAAIFYPLWLPFVWAAILTGIDKIRNRNK